MLQFIIIFLVVSSLFRGIRRRSMFGGWGGMFGPHHFGRGPMGPMGGPRDRMFGGPHDHMGGPHGGMFGPGPRW